MELELFGTAPKPLVTVVGTWEPFLPVHERLARRLRRRADEADMSASVIVLDPPPKQTLEGLASWPTFYGRDERVRRLAGTGLDAVIAVSLDERDLKGRAADLFEVLGDEVELGEFWLKNGQTLGRGEKGSHLAIEIYLKAKGIGFRPLPPNPEAHAVSMKARERLKEGAVAAAAELVGRPPARRRPEDGSVPLGWPEGRYLARPGRNGNGAALGADEIVEVEVEVRSTGRDGDATLAEWPDTDAAVLSFVRGPGDPPPPPGVAGS